MSRFDKGAVVWGVWMAYFAVVELVSVFWKGCPWPTLSSAVKDVEGFNV